MGRTSSAIHQRALKLGLVQEDDLSLTQVRDIRGLGRDYRLLEEVADRLRVGNRTVERLVASGELASAKFGRRRLVTTTPSIASPAKPRRAVAWRSMDGPSERRRGPSA